MALTHRQLNRIIRLSALLLDFIAIASSIVLAYYIRFHTGWIGGIKEYVPLEAYLQLIGVTPVWLLTFYLFDLYGKRREEDFVAEILTVISASAFSTILTVVFTYTLRTLPTSRLTLIFIFIISIVLVTVLRGFLRSIQQALWRKGIGVKRALVIGWNRISELLTRRILSLGSGPMRIISLIVPGKTYEELTLRLESEKWWTEFKPLLAKEEDFRGVEKEIIEERIDSVFYFGPVGKEAKYDLASIFLLCEAKGVEFKFLPEIFGLVTLPLTADRVEGLPILAMKSRDEIAKIRLIKRLFDITVSAIFLILFSWLYIIVALAILLTSGLPLLFVHRRLGFGGKPFPLLKFRTMVRDAASLPPPEGFHKKFKLKDDPRITKIGRFLRKTTLDEFPQMVNVLLGHISLVGPRPIVESELQRYGEWSKLLHSVNPGLTGLWQTTGRSELSYKERIELDVYYIQNWSFSLDLLIILRTLPALFSAKGAY